MTHITFDPYIPLALWVPLALAAAALLGWYAVAGRRRLPARRWWVVVALMARGRRRAAGDPAQSDVAGADSAAGRASRC